MEISNLNRDEFESNVAELVESQRLTINQLTQQLKLVSIFAGVLIIIQII